MLSLLAACQHTPAPGGLRVGKPYVIDGKTYYPEYDPTYDKIGQASWYGPGFHGKYTANGEVYNQNDLTAAHPTLPMPSLVRVTNLSNGHSLIVRVNDRGPFKSNRIIDLSKEAAHQLGITSTAQVRVQFLKKETDDYMASLQTGGNGNDMVAVNTKANYAKEASIISSTEPTGQIVESTVSSTHTGQTVNQAAPVLTVSSDELSKSDSGKKSVVNSDPAVAEQTAMKDLPKPAAPVLIHQAWADDKMASVSPPASLSPSAKPLIEQTEEPKNVSHKGKKSLLVKQSIVQKTPTAFYIQAGSFSAEDNAHKLSSKLSAIGPVDIGKVQTNEKTWWRVRLGPFHEQQEAQEALAKVRTADLPDARIVHQ